MAATVQAQLATGAGPTLTNAETGLTFNRADTLAGTTPIPIPTATGNKYSYLKYLALVVTGTGTTTISNRRISWATTPATGLQGLWFNQATYTQNSGTQGTAAGNYPADDTAANGTVPATPAWAAISTTPTQWDNTSVSTASTARNGNYVQCCLQVSNAFVGGAGSATTVATINLQYDEA
ncbi:MAG: hypothetical protein H0X24_23735 [Ktedonobacterales bacterium]|nr:hypothetical protein [Ktedonobacterales bacterium]